MRRLAEVAKSNYHPQDNKSAFLRWKSDRNATYYRDLFLAWACCDQAPQALSFTECFSFYLGCCAQMSCMAVHCPVDTAWRAAEGTGLCCEALRDECCRGEDAHLIGAQSRRLDLCWAGLFWCGNSEATLQRYADRNYASLAGDDYNRFDGPLLQEMRDNEPAAAGPNPQG